eukprot:COSAG03_NODE_1830_length_3461_cov_4.027365_4_plen_91_part_00
MSFAINHRGGLKRLDLRLLVGPRLLPAPCVAFTFMFFLKKTMERQKWKLRDRTRFHYIAVRPTRAWSVYTTWYTGRPAVSEKDAPLLSSM